MSKVRIDEVFQGEVLDLIKDLEVLNSALVYRDLSSTNDQALALEQQQVQNGTLVLASVQSKGRGRLNRSWFMTEGDIALSIILRPPFLPKNLALLPMIPALAMVEALAKLSIPARLKWPNDIIIASDESFVPLNYLGNFRKVGGILIENVFRTNLLAASIVGIGLNIMKNPQLETLVPHSAYLKLYSPPIDRLVCLRHFLAHLDKKLLEMSHNPNWSVINDYTSYCETLGRNVTVVQGSTPICGYATHIEPDGALVVNDGRQNHIIRAGDVIGY